ncbi:MAG: hypothetical protein ACXVNM_14905, partial [Bacteroidia bacterium]
MKKILLLFIVACLAQDSFAQCSLSVSVTSTNIACFGGTGGSASAAYSGNVGSVSFLWQPGGYTSQTISNIGVGTYSVTITDSNCSVTGTVTISQPSIFTATAAATNALCNNSATG